MKMIVTMIPTNVDPNSLLSLFFPFKETKNKNKIFTKLVVWFRQIVLLFVLKSHTLLQRYAEFNKLLQKNFLTCYSCFYYSSVAT